MTSTTGLVREVRGVLASAGIDQAAAEARWIVAHVLGIAPGELALRLALGEDAPEDAVEQARRLAAERATRRPLQHVLGEAPFRALTLAVGPGVFVPRPETELLAGAVIDWLHAERTAGRSARRVLEAGTGSAAIALAIATETPGVVVETVEVDPDARRCAQRNIAAAAPDLDRVGSRVRLRAGDAVAALAVTRSAALDVVVSNPPYVPEADIPAEPEARADPAIALYAGADGLDVIRALLPPAARALRPGGLVALEHTERQGARVRALAAAAGLVAARTHPDLTGRDRFTTALAPAAAPQDRHGRAGYNGTDTRGEA